MENNINKESQDKNNKPYPKSRKKYTPKKKSKTISDTELNEKLKTILKEEAEKIKPTDNQLHYKISSEEEEKERIRKKYISTPDDDPEYLIDKLISDMNSLSPENTTEDKTEESTEEETFSQEDIDVIAQRLNEQISILNQKFYSLVKVEENIPVVEEIKIKISKPRTIKIPKETYKQIKSHCKEHNVDIEDWIEKITLNEINRIIIRLGDLDYKNLKERKKKNNKKKEKSI